MHGPRWNIIWVWHCQSASPQTSHGQVPPGKLWWFSVSSCEAEIAALWAAIIPPCLGQKVWIGMGFHVSFPKEERLQATHAMSHMKPYLISQKYGTVQPHGWKHQGSMPSIKQIGMGLSPLHMYDRFLLTLKNCMWFTLSFAASERSCYSPGTALTGKFSPANFSRLEPGGWKCPLWFTKL